jgi:hypothetical protein
MPRRPAWEKKLQKKIKKLKKMDSEAHAKKKKGNLRDQAS